MACAAVLTLLGACMNKASPVLRYRDPNRLTVSARGAGSWTTITPDPNGNFAYSGRHLVSGNGFSIPKLVNPWKLGMREYELSGRYTTNFSSQNVLVAGTMTRETFHEYFDYKIRVPVDNIEYIEHIDEPDRGTAKAMLISGVLVGGLGYLMTLPDTRWLQYPGYVFVGTGLILAGVGVVNLVRPKRAPVRYVVPGSGTPTAKEPIPAAVPVPPTSPGLRWVKWSGTLPADAVQVGAEYHVCRFVHEGALHVGKLHKASTCYIAWGDLEHHRTDGFEVLTGKARWGKQGANGSVVGGIETFGVNKGQPLSVCRTEHHGEPVAGKAMAGYCFYGYGGRAQTVTDFEYLYPAQADATVMDVSGRWSTTIYWDHGQQHADADVVFTQTGTTVVGVFHLPNEGRIEGTLSGNKLTGTWRREPLGGHIELTFDLGTRTFTGVYGDTPAIKETWSGRKL